MDSVAQSYSLCGTNYLLKSKGPEDHLQPLVKASQCRLYLGLPFLLNKSTCGFGDNVFVFGIKFLEEATCSGPYQTFPSIKEK